MSEFRIKEGLNIRLAGRPEPVVRNAPAAPEITVYPGEFEGLKPRLAVAEGDTVKRGSVLFVSKQNEALKFRSPAAGRVKAILRGARRALEQIVIEAAADEEIEPLPRYPREALRTLDRQPVLDLLLDTGFLTLLRQRPYSHMADPTVKPKAIFVNAMHTAPLAADPAVALQGQEAAFQAGLDVLSRLTDGAVHLCHNPDAPDLFRQAEGIETHTFSGPHPAGNTSVHIHHIDPIRPGEVVWTAQAADVALIGELFTEGALPATRIISIGGPALSPEARAYYRIRIGAPLKPLLESHLTASETRIIEGDVLSGVAVPLDQGVRFFCREISVLAENRERHFLGWLAPGLTLFSASRLFLSRWLKPRAEWALDTSQHGSPRAMVMTGWYDRVVPLRIMTDFLVRAVLAHDSEEAVQLGLLETDPEDFALASFICPSKTDVCGIIRRGLAEAEEEGF